MTTTMCNKEGKEASTLANLMHQLTQEPEGYKKRRQRCDEMEARWEEGEGGQGNRHHNNATQQPTIERAMKGGGTCWEAEGGHRSTQQLTKQIGHTW
jgi:hypothetical protein